MEVRLGIVEVVEGSCEGRPLVIDDYVSFYGEVDATTSLHRPTGQKVAGTALVIRGGRGSTVGSYVLYALKKFQKAPACIIVERLEPVVVAGCVLSDIPLLLARDYEKLVVEARTANLLVHERGSHDVILFK
ncbi:MAG: DUF126 domain-containing protein [Desulfurococcaceae archaeon]